MDMPLQVLIYFIINIEHGYCLHFVSLAYDLPREGIVINENWPLEKLNKLVKPSNLSNV